MVFWIITGSIITFLFILSFLPVWCIRWRYADLSRATVADVSKKELSFSNIPQGWMLDSEDKNIMLWTILFGNLTTGKSVQNYTYVYRVGNNIKYKIGLSLLESFK